MKKCTLALFVFLLVAGCAHVGVTTLKEAEAKPITCNLDIYTSDKEVEKKFDVLCLLDARTTTVAFSDRSVAGAINLVKPDACSCGADGIIVVDSRQEGMTLVTNGQGFVTVKAIKYKP